MYSARSAKLGHREEIGREALRTILQFKTMIVKNSGYNCDILHTLIFFWVKKECSSFVRFQAYLQRPLSHSENIT